MQALGIATPMDHPALGGVEVVGQAVHLTRTPQPPRVRMPTPALGEHTDGVLSELGYEAAAIADLRERHVI